MRISDWSSDVCSSDLDSLPLLDDRRPIELPSPFLQHHLREDAPRDDGAVDDLTRGYPVDHAVVHKAVLELSAVGADGYDDCGVLGARWVCRSKREATLSAPHRLGDHGLELLAGSEVP